MEPERASVEPQANPSGRSGEAGLGRRAYVDWHMSASGLPAEPSPDLGDGYPEYPASSDHASPGFAPILPEHEPQLQMHRKLPRGLHIWFAVGLGVVAVGVALGQQLWSARRAAAPGAARVDAPASAEPDPSLLERELARQRRAPVAPSAHPRGRSTGAGVSLVTPAASGAAPVGTIPPLAPERGFPAAAAADGTTAGAAAAAGPGVDDAALSAAVPSELLAPAAAASGTAALLPPGAAATGALTADAERTRALVAGSRILALSHVTPGGLDNNALDTLDPGSGTLQTRLGALAQSAPQLLHDASAVLRRLTTPGPDAVNASSLAATAVDAGDRVTVSPALRPRRGPAGPLLLEGTAIPVSC